MKVNFGVPFARVTEEEVRADARAAVACALEMQRELVRVNKEWSVLGRPTVAMRIGIASGPVVVGSLGSEDRLKYTSVGDVVVTAQRLEAFDQTGHDFELEPSRILISEQTLQHVGQNFQTAPIGEFLLKGKGEPVLISRVLGSRWNEGMRPSDERRGVLR